MQIVLCSGPRTAAPFQPCSGESKKIQFSSIQLNLYSTDNDDHSNKAALQKYVNLLYTFEMSIFIPMSKTEATVTR